LYFCEEKVKTKHALYDELFGLSGKVAVVTGATKGLGKAIAETLAAAGARVAICGRSDKEAVGIGEEIANKSGQDCFGMAADVAKPLEIEKFFTRVKQELGSVDILVANAGVTLRKETAVCTERDFDTTLNINLKGAFFSVKAVLPDMKTKKWGRIIFIGSIMSFVALPERSIYASSKAAIVGLTRSIAIETATDGICVNAICPGSFMTPTNIPILNDKKKYKALLEKIPLGRFGEPDEIRGLALYLASPASSFTTGSCILIDGGWTAQ
jgi:NAD(P)-dependent dehydrogenase (short-subunit alcohol dehydrogenase family)